MTDTRTIAPEFTVHELNETGMFRAREIASSFSDLLTFLDRVCQHGREYSIVKTKLEEACFFAKKAMASAAVHQKG